MKEYLLAMIGTILISAVLTSLAADGKTVSIIRNMTKLACLLVILSPIVKILEEKDLTKNNEISDNYFSETVIQTDSDFIQYYSELRIKSTEIALQKELFEKYKITSNVSIFWQYEKYDIRITQIKITLKEEQSEVVKQEMWEYLTKNYCSEVLIE